MSNSRENSKIDEENAPRKIYSLIMNDVTGVTRVSVRGSHCNHKHI